VGLSITEINGQTHAEARLVMPGGDELTSRGSARRNPTDQEITLVGEQIAAARALSDLAGKAMGEAEGKPPQNLIGAMPAKKPPRRSSCRIRYGRGAAPLCRWSRERE